MKISAQIDHLAERIQDILMEVEELKKQMEMLEKRNEQLSNYLQKEDKSQSAGNLIKLYEQGFHICHSSYGSIREEDCIFCLNVIDRTE